MSTVKAIPAPKAAAKKPPRKQSELRHSVGLINRFIEGQRGVFGMALFMLILESLTSIGTKFPFKWLLDYLNKGTPQPIANDITEHLRTIAGDNRYASNAVLPWSHHI